MFPIVLVSAETASSYTHPPGGGQKKKWADDCRTQGGFEDEGVDIGAGLFTFEAGKQGSEHTGQHTDDEYCDALLNHGADSDDSAEVGEGGAKQSEADDLGSDGGSDEVGGKADGERGHDGVVGVGIHREKDDEDDEQVRADAEIHEYSSLYQHSNNNEDGEAKPSHFVLSQSSWGQCLRTGCVICADSLL